MTESWSGGHNRRQTWPGKAARAASSGAARCATGKAALFYGSDLAGLQALAGGFMRWPDGRYIQAAIFFSRWLLAPFLIGLLGCLLVLMYQFFNDLIVLILQSRRSTWHEAVTGVLNLVDLALAGNLVLIVIFSGYENFIRKIDASAHPDWPEGLTQVDFGELKQKLLGSVVGIAAVDALAWYFDLEKETDTSKLIWVLGFPMVFALVMLILSAADWLSDNRKQSE
jgi:uncharacterized protein (TIGR00645 family)